MGPGASPTSGLPVVEHLEARLYARPLRTAAAFAAVASALWELNGRGVELAFGVLGQLWTIRVVETAVALFVFWAAPRARSLPHLRMLVWLLALDVAGANVAVMLVLPPAVWEALLVSVMVILGAALFAPWSWRWQAALAAAIVVSNSLAVMAIVDAGVVAPWMVSRIAASLLTAGAISVLGSWIKHRERRQVAESEARFRGLFDAAGDAIAILSRDGRVQDGNLRFEALLDAPLAALRDADLKDLLDPEPDERGRPRHLDKVLREVGARPLRVTGELRRPAGATVEVEVTFVRMPGPGGGIIQAILRDLTERRALERRHMQTQRVESIARLAAGLAHQFNNLLGGILNQAVLLRKHAAGAEVQGQLDAIAHAARRGERLTKELLRFTPHAAISVQPLPAGRILGSVRALARADEASGPLVIETAADLPQLAADPDHLVPALMELVFNARDAMRDMSDRTVRLLVTVEQVLEGDVRWSGAAAGQYVSFAIIDRGVGMDAATRERLFEPFFTTKAMHEAEGLGLATVYWVVRAHRGAIAIDSEPGKGSTVRVLIPVAAVSAPAPAPAARRDGVTVLLADDDELIQRTTGRALDQFGYRVVAVGDGAAAVAALEEREGAVDVALLDVVMPHGGAGLVDQIRQRFPAIRIIVTSGYGPGGEVQRMLDQGARAFLQKPYELTELRDVVERTLSV